MMRSIKVVLLFLFVIQCQETVAQSYDTLYIYDIWSAGDFEPRYSGGTLGSKGLQIFVDAGTEIKLDADKYGVASKRVIAQKAKLSALRIIKPRYQPVTLVLRGTSVYSEALSRNVTMQLNDTLYIDTVTAGQQHLVPRYYWNRPLMRGDFPSGYSYTGKGTYFHSCFKRKKKWKRLRSLLSQSVQWQYNYATRQVVQTIWRIGNKNVE
jgi:hypothetical protein